MGTKLLTIVEAADRLALRPGTIRKLIYQRRLPSVKLGRSVRLREEDLEALIRLGLHPLTGRRP
jgi:excisionase family DNA binding protein